MNITRKQYAAMSERERVITLLHWYNTPQSGVIDHEAWIITKPIIDELMFRLAAIDSGVKIPAALHGTFYITYFGVKRVQYQTYHEVSDRVIQNRERMALARNSRKRKSEVLQE